MPALKSIANQAMTPNSELVIAPESDVADSAQTRIQREEDKKRDDEDVPPADVIDDKCVDISKDALAVRCRKDAEADKAKDNYGRRNEDGFTQSGPNTHTRCRVSCAIGFDH